MAFDLLLGERNSLDDRRVDAMLVAELAEAGLDRLGDQAAGRVVVAELVDVALLVGPRRTSDIREAGIDLSKRRHPLADDHRHVREGNSHAKDFEGDSVELDALPSSELRALVRECIEWHIDASALETLREAEQSEREILEQLAGEYEG